MGVGLPELVPDADGKNTTLWPGFTFEYWLRTRRLRCPDYEVAADPVAVAAPLPLAAPAA